MDEEGSLPVGNGRGHKVNDNECDGLLFLKRDNAL